MKEECPNEGKTLHQNLHFQMLKNVNIIKLKVMTLNIVVYCIQNIIPTNLSTYNSTIMVYFIGKLYQKPIILTFGQFENLIIMDRLI